MRAIYAAATLVLITLVATGCASTAGEKPAVEHQEKLDATNIVPAQKAGYKLVNKDGQNLYCRRDLNVGSHLRYTTSCLSEAEWRDLSDASRQGVEAMRRDQLPRQGN